MENAQRERLIQGQSLREAFKAMRLANVRKPQNDIHDRQITSSFHIWCAVVLM